MSVKSRIASRVSATLLCSLVLVISISSRSEAQFVPLFGNIGPFLNREDFTFADAAAHKLFEPEPAALGTIAAWDNPGSGNSGILTMGRAYQKNGDNCRVVSWRDVFKDGADRTVMVDACRIAGVWKLM